MSGLLDWGKKQVNNMIAPQMPQYQNTFIKQYEFKTRFAMLGTTGAGDSTVAGFLAALLRSETLERAVTAAVAVGGCNVEAADALSGVRTWAETWYRVESGWARHLSSVPGPEWRFDELHRLWVGPAG